MDVFRPGRTTATTGCGCCKVSACVPLIVMSAEIEAGISVEETPSWQALARTLVNEPDVLLLDEPFASLDFQNKLLIENDTAKLVRRGGRSLLLITHDIEEAVSLADRVIVLSKRPTQVKAVYTIALGAERTDMMAARERHDFSQYVRRIWADLEVVLQ